GTGFRRQHVGLYFSTPAVLEVERVEILKEAHRWRLCRPPSEPRPRCTHLAHSAARPVECLVFFTGLAGYLALATALGLAAVAALALSSRWRPRTSSTNWPTSLNFRYTDAKRT